jgi:hypothetical protein
MGSMSCSEYLRAANFVRQRAAREQNPGAKEILQEIERSYRRLVEMEDWLAHQQNTTVHLLISDCSTESSPWDRGEPGRTHRAR